MNEYVYIIAEYNPPHGGHAYMIDEVRRKFPDAVITAIMSGSFAERGSPAVVNRFTRARAALSIGADLVVSIPFPWCMGSAEFFARAGVSVADAFAKAIPNAHHVLAFGSECGDTEKLTLAGTRLADERFRRELYCRGAEYHTARGVARLYFELYGEPESILTSPNDTLAVEYVRAVTELRSMLEPFAVKRVGAGHDSKETALFPSASAVRERIYAGDSNALAHLPESVADIIGADLIKYGAAQEENYGDAIISALRRYNPSSTHDIAECGGGVGERLISCAHKASSYSEMLSLAATKQYTNARLRRASIFAYLGIRHEDIASLPRYTQLLAANKKGTDTLHEFVRRAADIEILTKSANYGKMSPEAARQYELDANAESLYTLAFSPHLPSDTFLHLSPVIVK